MKRQTAQRWQSSLLATVLVLGTFALTFAQAQKNVGALFGAREPHTCKDAKQPLKGAPSAEQVKQYVVCEAEHVGGNSLYLIEDVTVHVGEGRPYNTDEDIDAPGIDTNNPVYPIHGGFKQYQCDLVSQDRSNAGRNCSVYDEPDANGLCYKTRRGEWVCLMLDVKSKKIKDNVAPPK